MPPRYPHRARALMRFKAQDGQFVLSPNAMVTVNGATDDDGDWVNVTSDDGQSGSVPSGFLVEVDEPIPEAGQSTEPEAVPLVAEPIEAQPTPNVVSSAVPPTISKRPCNQSAAEIYFEMADFASLHRHE